MSKKLWQHDDETCGKCKKFQPDKINPAGGLGSCPEVVMHNNLDGKWVEVLKYPGQRECNEWQSAQK